MVWGKVASNKRKETIYEAYCSAIHKYGHPLRIRSDYAGEHSLVERDIVAARPGVRRPYLTGSSVHNQVSILRRMNVFDGRLINFWSGFLYVASLLLQRIEKFWRQVWTHVAFFYKHLLSVMEEDGTLLIKNPWHKASMHAVFIPAIQVDLDNMIAMWNVHRVRKITENGRFLPSHVPSMVFKPIDRQMR